jgi:Ni,Fe-hydrogenase III component G
MSHLEAAQALLADLKLEWQEPEENRLDAQVDSAVLLTASSLLRDARWGYLSAITGLDNGTEIELLYHFCLAEAVLTLRLSCPYEAARVPSLCATYPYASVYERELIEMLGVEVEDTPDKSRLFLPDDWPEGVYPLRKNGLEGSDEREEN